MGIQVDMFAVGLGSSLLIQFALRDGSRVTVLADGGVGPHHDRNYVFTKLPEAFKSFGTSEELRIDLIVGTHYDGDHLKGLVPIIEADDLIEIGEVWLPPIKRDNQEIVGSLENDDFLAELFYDDLSGSILRDYLLSKAYELEELKEHENRAVKMLLDESNGRLRLSNYSLEGQLAPSINNLQEILNRLEGEEATRAFEEFFIAHQSEALSRTKFRPMHESAVYDSRHPSPFEIVREFEPHREPWYWRARHLPFLFANYPAQARIIPAALATIRESTAENAITAIHLNKVIQALRSRKSPIRPRCQSVADDRPSRFAWSQTSRSFVQRDKATHELVLTLLGPSASLIEEHATKLPVEQYVFASLSRFELLRRQSITVSNRLSYIFILEMKGQRILITGDAGCYGFRKNKKEFHEKLLRPLVPLNVIQVAHHAGHNYDFYNALLEAGFPKQKSVAFLLLSHAMDDEFRPSSAFHDFVKYIRRDRNQHHLLFTSKPRESKAAGLTDLIYRTVSNGSDEGDIRLSYRNRRWTVEKHAITVGAPVADKVGLDSVTLKRNIGITKPVKFKEPVDKK